MTGSCIDSVWKVYSLYRAFLISPPCLATSQSLPSDSLRCVIDSSTSSGRDIAQPSVARVVLLDSVCKLNHFKSLFSLSLVGRCFHRLSFPELFQLWDFSPYILSCFVFEAPSVGLVSLSSSSSCFGIFTSSFSFRYRCCGGDWK